MAAQRAKRQRVGNAGLYIGLPWHKRKSLPRDSRGFEPLDGYFLKKKVESDTDSSETDTEELIRQELAKRKEEKKMRLEARKKAALAAKETQANGYVGGEERDTEVEGLESKAAEKTVTDDAAGTETNSSQQVSQEELYSPQKSIMNLSPQRVMKVVPSRLSFSSSSESEGDSEDTKSTGRRKKVHGSIVSKPPQKTVSAKVLTTVALEPRGHGVTTGESMEVLANGVQQDNISVESAASSKSVMRTTDGSFHPRKTSTQMKTVSIQNGVKQRPSARKQFSSIHPVAQDVDVESAASSKPVMSTRDGSFHPRKTSTQMKTVSVQNDVKQKPSARKQFSSIHPVTQDVDVESAASSKSVMSTTDGSFHPRKTSTQMKTVSIQNGVKQRPSARKQFSSIHPVTQDVDVESAASSKPVMSTRDGSFHPRKTSTQMKTVSVQNGVKQRPSARKQFSSIHPALRVSDSESESEDEVLTKLLENASQSDVFQGLRQLTHSRSAPAARTADVTVKKLALPDKQRTEPRRREKKTNPSEGEATASREDTKGKRRRSTRRSVTFVDVSPLPASPRKSTGGTTTGHGAVKKFPTPKQKPQSSDKQDEAVVDPYDDFSTLDNSPPLMVSPVKKTKETTQTLSKTASSESLSGSSAKRTATPSSSKKTATPSSSKKTARKSILKEFSLVIRKEPSPPQRQWFVPDDVGSVLTRIRTSKTNVSQHAQSRQPSRESPALSGCEDEEIYQAEPSQDTTLLSRSGRRGSRCSKNSAASPSRTRAKYTSQVVEDSDDDDSPPVSPDMDASDGPSRALGLEDSAGSQRGVSALIQEEDKEDSDAGSRVLRDSNRPSRRKRAARVVLSDKRKRRKKKSTLAETREVEEGDHFWSGEEGERDGLEITYSAGGRMYRRLRVQPSRSHTPGVRRSKRTRIAPVRTWENEEVEYDMRRRSGAVIKGILVPVEDSTRQRKRKRVTAQSESEDDEEFPPVKITDRAGNVLEEKFVVKSQSSRDKINPWGEPAEKWDQVVITRLHSTPTTSNGMILFRSCGEKERSSTGSYEMFFYVMKGKLLFKINTQEYRLKPQMEIHIPARTIYNIKNLQRSYAEVFFYTSRVTESST